MDCCKIVAIAGGSCSGKTSLARHLANTLGEQRCALIYQDNYYRNDNNIGNYDEPQALEFELLALHLKQLKAGKTICMPTYDFATHSRTTVQQPVPPKPVIIVDGILILHAVELSNSFDRSVFVECDESIRRQRRIERDCAERGRTRPDVIKQFNEQVAPLHNQYVEPSKAAADIIYTNNGDQPIENLLCNRLLDFCLP